MQASALCCNRRELRNESKKDLLSLAKLRDLSKLLINKTEEEQKIALVPNPLYQSLDVNYLLHLTG